MTKEEIQQFIDIVKDGKNEEFFLSVVDDEGYILKSIYKKDGNFYTYFNCIDNSECPLDEIADEIAEDLSPEEDVSSELENIYKIVNLKVPKHFSLKLNSKKEWFKLKRKDILDCFNKHLSSEFFNTASQITESIDKDFKKVVSFTSQNAGILVAVVSTDEDYYWAYITKDKNVHLTTVLANYEIKENDEVEISDEEIKEILKKKFIDNEETVEVLVYCPLF